MKPSVILVFALIALAIGGIGLYFGLSSKNQLTQLELTVAQIGDNAKAAQSAAEQSDKNTAKLKQEVQNVLTQMSGDMSSLQLQFSELTNRTAKVKAPEAGKEGEVAKKGEGKAKPEKMAKPADGMYKIEKGDNLAKVAKKFGVSQNAIAVANPSMEMDKLVPGKKMRIP